MSLSTVFISLHSLGPSETLEYLFLNISESKEVNIISSISLLLGQMSLRKTSFPFLSFPRDDLYKSKFIVPAIAYATTNGGEAK